MRTITVTEKYRAVNEGRMSKTEFVRQMRQAYPMYVSPVGTYESTVQILKNKNMLFEAKEQEVDDTFKFSDDSLRRALDIELEAMGLMSQESISMDDQVKAKKKAVANLKKDPLHYYHLISGDSSKVNKHDKEVEVKRGALEKDTFNGMKKATLKEAKLMTEGTRALVGYLSGDRLTTTYNHYDGYPSNLGKGLETHYNDDEKAKEIAMKGYITGMDPDTGEISATHNDAPTKIKLPEEAYEIAKEIAEEIDSMGADYGYIWDDQLDKWATIKNTGIRSMIDQITDKLLNKPARDMDHAMQGINPDLYEKDIEEVDSSLDPYEDKKEIIRQVIELIKSSMPADNETIKSFIRTHYDDIINLGDDQAILDEFQEFLSVNTDYVDEAEPLDTTAAYDNDEETQDMIDKMRKDGKDSDDFVDEKKIKEDFAPSPNSNVPDANAEEYDVATAFKKAGVDMSKPVMVLHTYGSAAYGGSDKDEMSAEAAIKMLEAERQDRSKQYTDDGEEVPEDHHGYEFENYSVLEEDMPEGHEYKLAYFQTGDADFAITQEKSGVSEKKVNEYSDYEPGTIAPEDLYYSDKHGRLVALDDVDDKYHDSLELVYSKGDRIEGPMDEKKGKDHDGDGDVDGDDYMAAKDKAIKKAMGKDESYAMKRMQKAHNQDRLAGKKSTYDKAKDKDEKKPKMNEAVKNIITKVLEEQYINEAATNDLAKIADEYGDFEGLKPAVIALENIVTEIESFYDKTRSKIQKVYNDLGNVRNEEGLKVGAFIAPSIENAFKRDLKPIIKNQFHGGLDMPQVKRISQADVDKGYIQQEAPKETVFTPVKENK